MDWDLYEYLDDDNSNTRNYKITRSAERRIESFEDYKEILAYEIKKNKLAEFYDTYSDELIAAEKDLASQKKLLWCTGVESEFGRYKGSYNP